MSRLQNPSHRKYDSPICVSLGFGKFSDAMISERDKQQATRIPRLQFHIRRDIERTGGGRTISRDDDDDDDASP